MIFLRNGSGNFSNRASAPKVLTAYAPGDATACGIWLEAALPLTREDQTNFISLAATPDIAGVLVHGIARRSELEMCAMLLSVAEAETGKDSGSLGLIAGLETPQALSSNADFSNNQTRLRALCLDEDRLAASLNAPLSADLRRHIRSTLILSAAAAGVAAILATEERLEEDFVALSKAAHSEGFQGLIVNHGENLQIAQAEFAGSYASGSHFGLASGKTSPAST